MAKNCDICGGKTGLMNRFRCLDGVVCRRCYRIVSGNYKTTIARTPLLELKKRYVRFGKLLEEFESRSS